VFGLQNGSWPANWGQNALDQPLNGTDKSQTPESAREALKFLFSAEGAFFRDFIMDEVVRSIDAMSRAQVKTLVEVPASERPPFWLVVGVGSSSMVCCILPAIACIPGCVTQCMMLLYVTHLLILWMGFAD